MLWSYNQGFHCFTKTDINDVCSASFRSHDSSSAMVSLMWHSSMHTWINNHINTVTFLIIDKNRTKWGNSSLSHSFAHQGSCACTESMTFLDHRASTCCTLHLVHQKKDILHARGSASPPEYQLKDYGLFANYGLLLHPTSYTHKRYQELQRGRELFFPHHLKPAPLHRSLPEL